MVSLIRLFERMRIPFPFKVEQVLRLNEDISCAEAQLDFDYSPLSFENGIKLELKQLRVH